jgi:hypothetical protein
MRRVGKAVQIERYNQALDLVAQARSEVEVADSS